MTTIPYADLLAQVEALAGASLATAEQARVKIFANRRARKAHRECDYWPHLLYVGEERVVSDAGLLPLAQTGLEAIDKIIRIHAEDPFKSTSVYEYTEYYEANGGIQIAGYQAAHRSTGPDYTVDGDTIPAMISGRYYKFTPTDDSDTTRFVSNSDLSFTAPGGAIGYNESIDRWGFLISPSTGSFSVWTADQQAATPDLVTSWTAGGSNSGTFTITELLVYSAFITYLAGIPATYGDGSSEESDVPEPWFEYMAQGAYCDWLRSDGQTEKAMAEEVIAESLLNQQLEKVSRSNGNQVVTRIMSHGTKQAR